MVFIPSCVGGVSCIDAGDTLLPDPTDGEEGGQHQYQLSPLEKEVLTALEASPTVDKLLLVVSRVPAIHECPDYHLKITNAGVGDAKLACIAVARLANLSTCTADIDFVTADRRFGQLLECIR